MMKTFLRMQMAAVLAIGFQLFCLSAKSEAGVVRHCMVVKGNGGNWASTLAFMAETLEIKATEARALANATGEPVQVSLNCFAGSSSGAAAAIVYASLLRNPWLSADTTDESLRSPEELETLSKALRFLSIATDYTFKEKYELIHRALRFVMNRGIEDIENSGWWQRFAMEDEVALNLFGKLAVVARHLTPEDLTRSLGLSPHDGMAILASRYNIKTVVDLPTWKHIGDIPYFKSQLAGEIHAVYLRQVALINKASERIFETSGGNDYLWKTLLAEPIPDGFCMGAMVEFSEQGVLSKTLPAYSSLRTMVICNRETIAKIRSHPDYSSFVSSAEPYSDRLLYASATNLKSAFRTSIREYQLFKAQLETFDLAGINAYFEDRTDSFSDNPIDLQQAKFGNVGGWVPEKVLAIPMSWYLAATDNPSILVNHMSVFGYLNDGKVGPFSDIWFLRTVMGNRGKDKPFSEDGDEVKNILRDYRSYQEVLEKEFIDGELPKYKLDYRFTKVNWNLHLAPAALTNEGINLLALTLNETKRMEGDQGASNMVIYVDWITKCVYKKRLDDDTCSLLKSSFAAFSQPYGLTFVPSRQAVRLESEIPWWTNLGLD